MAKFTKYNNPSKRRNVRRSGHSEAYIVEMRKQRDELLARCKTDADRDMILKAYDVSIKP